MTEHVVKMCPHVRLDNSIPVVGLVNRDGSANWSCSQCTVDRWRRVIGFKPVDDILEDISLEHADVPGLLHEILTVMREYVTGAVTVKPFDPRKGKPVRWQAVRETRKR